MRSAYMYKPGDGITRSGKGSADLPWLASDLTTKALQLDTSASIEVGQGEMAWNSDEETFDFGMNGAVWQGGLENFQHVRNGTGSTITDGTPVMAIGTVGNSSRILVAPMDGTVNANAKFLIGIATYDIGTTIDTQDGKVTWAGKVRGIDTTGALSFGGLETWSDEDVLYVDPNNIGFLTNVEPDPPGIYMAIAFVVHAHENGTIETRVTPLDEHSLKVSPVCLSTYSAIPARNAEENIHGGLIELVMGHDLSAGDLVLTGATEQGIGKLALAVNAASDFAGEITVTGSVVDRETGVVTGGQTDTITIDALTVDGESTDANGETIHSLTGAYITNRWFTGVVTIASTDTTITNLDVYHISFEQFNDARSVVVRTVDINVLCTESNAAALSSRLYTVIVNGDKVDVAAVSEYVGNTFVSDRFYRIRRGNIDISFDGRTSGIFMTQAYLGSPSKFADAGTKIWADIVI